MAVSSGFKLGTRRFSDAMVAVASEQRPTLALEPAVCASETADAVQPHPTPSLEPAARGDELQPHPTLSLEPAACGGELRREWWSRRTICQRRNSVLAASVLFSFIGIGSAHFPVVVLKVLSEELGWPRSIPSTAYALMYISGGLGGVFMGWMLDRFGMTIPAFSGATAIGVSALLSSIINRPWQLYGTSVMVGLLGRSSIFVPLTTNIMRWFEDNKSFAVGVVGSGGMIGGAIWPLVFEHMVEAIGWRSSSRCYGLLVLAVNIPAAMVLRQAPPAAVAVPTVTSHSGKQTAADAPPRAPLSPCLLTSSLSVAAVCCCVAMSLPLAHLLSHVSDLGYQPARGAEVLSLTLTGASISSFFGVGYLGKKLGAAPANSLLRPRLH